MGPMMCIAVQQRRKSAYQLCCQGCSGSSMFRQNVCIGCRNSCHSEMRKYFCPCIGATRLYKSGRSSRRERYRLRYRRSVENKCWSLDVPSSSYNLGNLAACPSYCVSHEDVGGCWGDCRDKPIYLGRGKIARDLIFKAIRTMSLYVVFFVLAIFVQVSIMWSDGGICFGCSTSGALCAGRFLLRWGLTEVSVPSLWVEAGSGFAACGSSAAEIDAPKEQCVCSHAANRRYPPCACQVVER